MCACMSANHEFATHLIRPNPNDVKLSAAFLALQPSSFLVWASSNCSSPTIALTYMTTVNRWMILDPT
jgi:hypothetical protein